ncbi:hypothetical protein [Brevundimonas subvibrioides]|nr:hypothetical protein [Brevundimonas subvibrioides]
MYLYDSAGGRCWAATALRLDILKGIDPVAERAEDLEKAKRRPLGRCAEGRTRQAVMTMCMAASRVGSVSPAHMDLLADVGLELADKNDWSELEAWISGFG